MTKRNCKVFLPIIMLATFLFALSLFLFGCNKKAVQPESIEFTTPERSLFKGQGCQLDLNINPENARGFKLIWSSSNKEIASVNRMGYVTSKNYGEVDIKVEVDGTDLSATCHITVDDGDFVYFDVDFSKMKIDYFEGQEIDTSGLKVVAVYESGKRTVIPEEECTLEYSPYASKESEIVVRYKDLKPKTVELLVFDDYIENIEISSLPNKTSYFIGESLDSEGLEINAVWASGKKTILEEFTVDSSPIQVGQNSVKVTYEDLKIDIPIKAVARITVNSLSALQKAIDDGIDSIMIKEGIYNTTSQIIFDNTKNIVIFAENQNVVINGHDTQAIKLIGEIENVSLYDITLNYVTENDLLSPIDSSELVSGELKLLKT